MKCCELKEIYENFIGFSSGKIPFKYTWKDVSLYNLAIGGYDCKNDDLYELNRKNMVPTFATICCYNIINNITNEAPITYASFDLLKEQMMKLASDEKKCVWLDFDHEMIFHRPMEVSGDEVLYEDVIEDVYDRYKFGVVIKNRVNVYDKMNRLLVENIGNTAFLWGGGFGGKKFPASRIVMPDRAPDMQIYDEIDCKQHLIYRLLGDTSKMHVDDEYAKERGLQGATVHGFLTLGIACKHLICACLSQDMNRINRIKVQFKNLVYPKTKIVVEIWRIDNTKALFRVVNREDGKILLDRGEFEYS